MIDAPATPVLATVAGVELGSVGFWNISNIQDWHPTADDMAAAVAALDCPAVRRPVLKFGHTGESGEGDPAIGLVDNLRLTEDGQTLVGDFVGVPAWLADSDAEGRSVIASAYPDRSGEWEHNYTCQLGHTHPFVLHAMSLLGVIRPGIGTLESLYDLYTKAPEKEEVAVAKATVALAGTTTDQVRKAYYDGPGSNWMLWIREMYVDPPELIVQNDADDSIERVPYTVSGDGDVEFGDGQAVKVEYVAARAKAEKPCVAFASKSEARPGSASKPPNPSAAEAEVPNGKEGAMPTLKEGLAQKLGIAADADDDAVIKAFDEALAAKSDETDSSGELDTPAQVAAAAKRLGMTTMDEQSATQLRADAAAGREALSRIQRDEDTKVVKTAIAEGKIPPAREDHYVALMERDREGTTAWLASVPKEAAVPLTELGHSTEPETNVAESAGYKNWRNKR